MRSSVYDFENFAGRVQFAAAVIARRGATSRSFDTCCEMYDGEAVIAALVRRAKKRPNGSLAKNLYHYIDQKSAEAAYQKTIGMDLTAHAAQLRASAQREADRNRQTSAA